MNQSILEAIDEEIARLQFARALLAGSNSIAVSAKRGPGRPKGTKTANYVTAVKKVIVCSVRKRAQGLAQRRRGVTQRTSLQTRSLLSEGQRLSRHK